jgi:hypothetical protein
MVIKLERNANCFGAGARCQGRHHRRIDTAGHGNNYSFSRKIGTELEICVINIVNHLTGLINATVRNCQFCVQISRFETAQQAK